MEILLIWPKPKDLIIGNYEIVPTTLFHKFILRSVSFPKPLTLPILAALTPKKHSVKIIEGMYSDIDFDGNYSLIGITCTTRYAPAAYEIADGFRRRGVTVVLGGWHPSALPEEAKQHADSVVIGEAEETWPQLLKDFDKERLKPFYKQEKLVDPLLIPHPLNIYRDGSPLGVQATRGCPYGCEFCSITNMKFRNIFRMRPINSVIEEIKDMPRAFNFHDNSLTIDLDYTKQLFREMKGLNKKFSGFGNINLLGNDDEFLKLASEAGCISWLIGFESVSQKSLDAVGKTANKVREYKKSVKKIHDYGMSILGSFVIGFDHDSPDIFDNTMEMVNRCEIDAPDAMILTPLPGTPLFDRLEKEKRILTRDWSKYNFENVVFQPKQMSAEELLNGVKGLYKEYYSSFKITKRILKGVRLGFHPFFDTLMQNLYMSTKRYIL